MKIKPLKIIFQSIDDFAEESRLALKNAVQKKKPTIGKKNVLVWASVEAYQQFMSDQKYAILAAIYKHQPSSVYQLAKILNRAQQNVARDCDSLEGHGFIQFCETGDKRKSKAPRLAFPYNAILVCLPNAQYQIEFMRVA